MIKNLNHGLRRFSQDFIKLTGLSRFIGRLKENLRDKEETDRDLLKLIGRQKRTGTKLYAP